MQALSTLLGGRRIRVEDRGDRSGVKGDTCFSCRVAKRTGEAFHVAQRNVMTGGRKSGDFRLMAIAIMNCA
jgi:hypothetical protein